MIYIILNLIACTVVPGKQFSVISIFHAYSNYRQRQENPAKSQDMLADSRMPVLPGITNL